MGQLHLSQLPKKAVMIGSSREAREGFLEEVTHKYGLKEEREGVDLAKREGRVHQTGETSWAKAQQEYELLVARRIQSGWN